MSFSAIFDVSFNIYSFSKITIFNITIFAHCATLLLFVQPSLYCFVVLTIKGSNTSFSSFGFSLQSGVGTAYYLSPNRPAFNVKGSNTNT